MTATKTEGSISTSSSRLELQAGVECEGSWNCIIKNTFIELKPADRSVKKPASRGQSCPPPSAAYSIHEVDADGSPAHPDKRVQLADTAKNIAWHHQGKTVEFDDTANPVQPHAGVHRFDAAESVMNHEGRPVETCALGFALATPVYFQCSIAIPSVFQCPQLQLNQHVPHGWAYTAHSGYGQQMQGPEFALGTSGNFQCPIAVPSDSQGLQLQPEQGHELRYSQVRGRVRELSFTAEGCRCIQQVIRTASANDVVALASELHGSVRAACWSYHANHVIQRLVETLPSPETRFIPEELAGVAVQVSCHRSGCRVLRCLFDQCSGEPAEPALVNLAAELCQDDVVQLSDDFFATHVMQAMLGSRNPSLTGHTRHVRQALVRDAFFHASKKNASRVLELAISCGHSSEQEALLSSIVDGNETTRISQQESTKRIKEMTNTQMGRGVLKAFFKVLPAARLMLVRRILLANRQGQRLLQEIWEH